MIILSAAIDEAILTVRAYSARAAHRGVIRARIVVAAGGQVNVVIAADLGLHVDTVRKWRRRF